MNTVKRKADNLDFLVVIEFIKVHYLYCIACWISSLQLALAELPRLKAIHQGRGNSGEKEAKFDPGGTKRRFTFSVG